MKTFSIFILLAALALGAVAQAPEQVLATAGPQKFTVADLSPELAASYVNLSKDVAELRLTLLDAEIADTLFALEAASKGIAPEKFVEQIKAKVPDPSAAEITAVYDANRAAIGDRTLEQVRPQIVRLLREDPEKKALVETFTALKAKYKIVRGKDINAISLRPVDVVATVGTKAITAQHFDEVNRVLLYETKARVFDKVKAELNGVMFSTLISAEAKALGIESNDLMAREITDKMRDFTDEERQNLEIALRKKLYAKYKVQVLLKEPAPLVFAVSTDGAPSKGPATAPVTVVMFSDFQCSACAATHPVLQKVIAEYRDKVRFVTRNFPLTEIHENAFRAAIAAAAAHAQGKFFEYAEILYRNQNALDAESLKKYAVETGLNLPQFELDLQSERLAGKVRKDMVDGRSYGISSTPTIFVNGVKVRVLSAEGFREAIDRALRK